MFKKKKRQRHKEGKGPGLSLNGNSLLHFNLESVSKMFSYQKRKTHKSQADENKI